MSKSADKSASPLTYKDAGVDIEAGNILVDRIKAHAKSTSRSGTDASLGGFGGLFDLKAAGYRDPILVAANDGVGTKLKVAIEVGLHDTVGIDLVAMCVNDLVVQGAEPLFFLDYFACGKLDPDVAEAVVSGIAEGCRQAGCALIGGETAEMPGMYAQDDYDLAGFAVGAAERGALLPRNDVAPGDVIVGLASNGPHSNGYSLIRRIVEREGLQFDDDAPFAPRTRLGHALLAPTRIYVRPLLETIRGSGAIKALAHITGGGFVENIPRVLPNGTSAHINLGLLPKQDVFGWLAAAGRVAEAEMLRTFNCGAGMIAVVEKKSADTVLERLGECGEEPFVLGDIRSLDGDRVTFSGSLQAAG